MAGLQGVNRDRLKGGLKRLGPRFHEDDGLFISPAAIVVSLDTGFRQYDGIFFVALEALVVLLGSRSPPPQGQASRERRGST